MKAMILAAGRGARMRPLTDHTPKPLLSAGGRPLIVWQLEKMAACGITEVSINLAHLGEQIAEALGDGSQFGLRIRYSREPEGALETAGGIATARPWLDAPQDYFLVANGDVFSDWAFEVALNLPDLLSRQEAQACLVMVSNPDHHPQGDFERPTQTPGHEPAHLRVPVSAGPGAALPMAPSHSRSPSVTPDRWQSLTYSGMGIFHPSLFAQTLAHQRAPLAPLLRQAAAEGRLLGLHHEGQWTDVGTPERLSRLDQSLSPSAPSQT